MTLLSPVNLATERMVTIAFPYRHGEILTTKRAVGMLAVMWTVAGILALTITISVLYKIFWPLVVVKWDLNSSHSVLHIDSIHTGRKYLSPVQNYDIKQKS